MPRGQNTQPTLKQGEKRDSKHGPGTHLSRDLLRVSGDKVLAIAKPGTGLASHRSAASADVKGAKLAFRLSRQFGVQRAVVASLSAP